ncbi:MAG: hypothetical protein ACYCQJ_01420 [Nitrososphaerales archaeon]
MTTELIQSIFLLDDKIRYASVLNQRGNHLEGGMKPGKNTINPEEESEKLFLQTTVSRGMSESWRRYFDKFRFSIVAHKKLVVFQFPYGENTLLVTAEPDISLNTAEKICGILDKTDPMI